MSYSLWDIVSRINPKDRDVCLKLDNELAERLSSIDDIYSIYYYIPHQYSNDLFKETSCKINSIITEHLDNTKESIQWYRLRSLSQYFDKDTKEKVIKRWISEPEEYAIEYIFDIVPNDSEIVIAFLNKAVACYKKRKAWRNLNIIGETFKKVSSSLLEDACKILSSSTPAVAACLLSRSDINDDYTLKGLKSISKLKARHSVQKVIKLEMLRSLGPRGRLDAINHLLHEIAQGSVPLDPMPTKEELQEFLFPCAFKYNDEVVRAIQGYEYVLKNIRR